MSGIKSLLGEGATGVDDFDLGEDFGRYAMGQELLPLLKALSYLLARTVHGPHTVAGTQLAKVIADIERPPKQADVSEAGPVNGIPF